MSAPYAYAWIAIAIAVCANIVANVSLKLAMNSTVGLTGSSIIVKALTSWTFWLGGGAAAVLLLAFLFALRTLPGSVAYAATTACAIVGLTLVEAIFVGQSLTSAKLAGAVLIAIGIVLITRS